MLILLARGRLENVHCGQHWWDGSNVRARKGTALATKGGQNALGFIHREELTFNDVPRDLDPGLMAQITIVKMIKSWWLSECMFSGRRMATSSRLFFPYLITLVIHGQMLMWIVWSYFYRDMPKSRISVGYFYPYYLNASLQSQTVGFIKKTKLWNRCLDWQESDSFLEISGLFTF